MFKSLGLEIYLNTFERSMDYFYDGWVHFWGASKYIYFFTPHSLPLECLEVPGYF